MTASVCRVLARPTSTFPTTWSYSLCNTKTVRLLCLTSHMFYEFHTINQICFLQLLFTYTSQHSPSFCTSEFHNTSAVSLEKKRVALMLVWNFPDISHHRPISRSKLPDKLMNNKLAKGTWILWDPKVYYSLHKNLPQSQRNPLHILTLHSFIIRFNVTLPIFTHVYPFTFSGMQLSLT